MRRFVSLRIRNFESGKLKVNDHIGNPIEIAAIVVWRVVETAEAMFEVNDYEHFVHVQSESALRAMSAIFPVRRARTKASCRCAARWPRCRSGWHRRSRSGSRAPASS